jgi:hypothetical protein
MPRSLRTFTEAVYKGGNKIVGRWEWLEKVGLLEAGQEGDNPGLYNDDAWVQVTSLEGIHEVMSFFSMDKKGLLFLADWLETNFANADSVVTVEMFPHMAKQWLGE